MTRDAVLDDALTAERQAQEALEAAARLISDPGKRQLFLDLARREEALVRERERQAEELAAVEFVQQALDV